jgi:hypothetical protein
VLLTHRPTLPRVPITVLNKAGAILVAAQSANEFQSFLHDDSIT